MARTATSTQMGAVLSAAEPVPPNLDPLLGETANLRRKLRETAHPCGCKSGAALSLLAILAWPVWTWASGPPHTLFGVVLALFAYPVVVIVAGFAGKLAGILTGRLRHRRLRRRLAQRLASVSAPTPPLAHALAHPLGER